MAARTVKQLSISMGCEITNEPSYPWSYRCVQNYGDIIDKRGKRNYENESLNCACQPYQLTLLS